MCSDYSKNLSKLSKIFGVKIEEPEMFQKALTHSSFTRENGFDSANNYERLEFLGDAVLKLCISDILYKKYPEYPEGELTKIRSIIVSDNTLAEIAEHIGLNKLIILGEQEEKTGGRDRKSIMACAFEAVLGAFYLNGKLNNLFTFLEKAFLPYIKDVDANFEKFNSKAVLQEYTQSINKKTPEYKIIEEKGPEHNKTFIVEVYFMEKALATGSGKTKKEAEQECAFNACKKLGVIK